MEDKKLDTIKKKRDTEDKLRIRIKQTLRQVRNGKVIKEEVIWE